MGLYKAIERAARVWTPEMPTMLGNLERVLVFSHFFVGGLLVGLYMDPARNPNAVSAGGLLYFALAFGARMLLRHYKKRG